MARPDISVIIPVYNEAPNIEPLARQTGKALDGMALAAEILFVNDASEDETTRILERLHRDDPRIRAITMEERSGQSAAIWAGFRHAEGDVFVTLDGDLQNDPADIPAVLERLTDADMVCGWRVQRNDSRVKRISSRIGNGFRKALLHDTIHDTGCGLKAIRRECALSFVPFNGMHRFFASLALMHGFRVVEMPVSHHPRQAGKTKYGIGNRALRGFVDCFGVVWLRRRRVNLKARNET